MLCEVTFRDGVTRKLSLQGRRWWIHSDGRLCVEWWKGGEYLHGRATEEIVGVIRELQRQESVAHWIEEDDVPYPEIEMFPKPPPPPRPAFEESESFKAMLRSFA